MKEHISTPFLRESLEFTIGVIDFSDNLIRMKKESIATKILDSAVGISSNLQLCKTAAKPSESNEFLRQASTQLDTTMYWLDQCRKSESFPRNDELIVSGKSLREKLTLILTQK